MYVHERNYPQIQEMMQRKIMRLDRLKGVAVKIGICCSAGMFSMDYEVGNILRHQAPIGCRKEKNQYIMNAFNAGLGALGKVSKSNEEWGKTVIEFLPVSKEIALDCMSKISEVYHEENDLQDAIKKYTLAFQRLTPREIPGLADRPFQRISNCGIRNYMEWIIYTLQRLDESELANEIVFFHVIQNESTHIKPPIQPLKKKEDDDFFIV
jgi:hypothetical protein